MKLNYKYTIKYAVITFIVLLIGVTIVYQSIKYSNIQSLSAKLEAVNQNIATQLKSGKPFDEIVKGNNVTVREVSTETEKHNIRKTLTASEYNRELMAEMPTLKQSSFVVVNGKEYCITSSVGLSEPDSIYRQALILMFAWVFIFLLALVAVASELTSATILRPFNDTLRAIHYFQIDQENAIDVHDTKTKEFNDLNAFLVKMTNKAKSDFIALKEFSENASHELQTPIATMKAKVEMLMNTNLEESQLTTLSVIDDELERVAKINYSLTLLAKLENIELDKTREITLGKLVEKKILHLWDWIEMKRISLSSSLQRDVHIKMEPELGEIILTNLFSNAIRHNNNQGNIVVELVPDCLTIKNTGSPPAISEDQVFGRFKKGNKSLNSIGLGLSIVKKICDLYGYTITYSYANGWHVFTMRF